jgi:hypothetical protein
MKIVFYRMELLLYTDGRRVRRGLFRRQILLCLFTVS